MLSTPKLIDYEYGIWKKNSDQYSFMARYLSDKNWYSYDLSISKNLTE